MVARAFRRAVCGAPSRRGSDDSYQELTGPTTDDDHHHLPHVKANKSEGVTLDTTDQNAVYIKMIDPVDVCGSARRKLSAEDWALLDALDASTVRRSSGRFLTMHKRRRKRLTTRTLSQEPAILDDIMHGQVQSILDHCGKWAFNAFALETAAGGRSLPVLCVHLFHWYGLTDYFQLDLVRVWKLFSLIEEGYHSTNPYHNSIHATDVTQAMHCFLQEEKIKKHITPLEVMASLIAAVTHDLDHPGVNQHFLISTSNHLAALYQNMSVLENHHWRSAVGCLLESGVAEQLSHCRNELEEQIRSLILATDITRQQEFLSKLKIYLDSGTLDLTKLEDRHFILQIALKCADISNPTRPWDISKKWSYKVCEEFFRQGDFERKLNLPVTSLCDKQTTSISKIQTGFFRFVVSPLFTEWHRFLHSSLSGRMMRLLDENRRKWEAYEVAELAEETQTELSDAEPEPEISDDDDDGDDEDDDGEADNEDAEDGAESSETLLVSVELAVRRDSLAVPEASFGRRHSMPTAASKLLLPRAATHRRESLPHCRTLQFAVPKTPKSPKSPRSPRSPRSPDSKASSGHIREEDELRFGSQSSLFSSTSGGHHHSGLSEDDVERPLSAENLLPEPSIATITSSAAATRLTSVLHGSGPATGRSLTRQQTFPPLQSYVRVRYMSTTNEMATCAETLMERESRSSSSDSDENVPNSGVHQPIPSIAVLSPNNGRSGSDLILDVAAAAAASASAKPITSGSKREQDNSSDKEKAAKIVKLGDVGERYEKENVDPSRISPIGLERRRGSAPVTLPFIRPEELGSASGGIDDRSLRRGSMPVDALRESIASGSGSGEGMDSVLSLMVPEHQRESLFTWQRARRGSAPPDGQQQSLSGLGERRDFITRHLSLNGKSGRRKKQLKRRSSGGPETMCLPDTSDSWHRLKRELTRRPDNPEALLMHRRGSLPIEVLTVGHSVF